jgi:hypothetical protein
MILVLALVQLLLRGLGSSAWWLLAVLLIWLLLAAATWRLLVLLEVRRHR